MPMLIAILIGAFLCAPAPASAVDLIVGPASVVDGETLGSGGQRVRLFGIDAPEAEQTCDDASGAPFRCGLKAAIVLYARIGDGVVTCEPKGIDQNGQPAAICRVFGEDLNAWMVG